MVMRLVTRLGDRLQSFFLGDVLGDHLAHFFEMIAARIEQSEARQGSRDEMIVQRLIAAQGFERQLAFAEGEEERMPLGVPAIADRQDPLGDRAG